jgi:hypothetical protein
MSGVVRPETAFYEPGICVATKLAEDGGQEYVTERITGIVLGVEDAYDRETGENLGRQFEVLDFRSGPKTGVIVHRLAEAKLDLTEAHPAEDRELRLMRRRLCQLVGNQLRTTSGKPQNPMTGSVEVAAMRPIVLLWDLEVHR